MIYVANRGNPQICGERCIRLRSYVGLKILVWVLVGTTRGASLSTVRGRGGRAAAGVVCVRRGVGGRRV